LKFQERLQSFAKVTGPCLGSKKSRFWTVLRVTEASAASDDVDRQAAEGGRRCAGGERPTGNRNPLRMSKFSSALRAESSPAAEGGRWRGIFASRRLAGRVRCLTTFSSLASGLLSLHSLLPSQGHMLQCARRTARVSTWRACSSAAVQGAAPTGASGLDCVVASTSAGPALVSCARVTWPADTATEQVHRQAAQLAWGRCLAALQGRPVAFAAHFSADPKSAAQHLTAAATKSAVSPSLSNHSVFAPAARISFSALIA